MKINQVNTFRELTQIQNPILQFNGELNPDSVLNILHETHTLLLSFGEGTALIRKAQMIVTELLQNIVRHGQKAKEYSSQALFILDRQNHKYQIICGNLVNNRQMEILDKKLSHLNQLDEEGIQAEYQSAIRHNMDHHHKNGKRCGLGLIETARRSQEKFQYLFRAYSPRRKYFILIVHLNRDVS